MSREISHLRQFGKFRLDVEKKVLWHEDHPVELPLKEIELLCVLTEKRGDVVTKNELLERVWSESFVEESNLSRHIYLLRKTFRDFGENEDLIQTVPRRGYRFVGDVKDVGYGDLVIEKHTLTQTLIEEINGAGDGAEEKTKSARTSSRASSTMNRTPVRFTKTTMVVSAAIAIAIVIGAIALVQHKSIARNQLSSIRSIAVLPFSDLAHQGDNDHSGIGIADLLITRLSNISEIKVRPTSAIMMFEDKRLDSISAGRQLDVDAVLEGTIYRTADKVRVTTRLVKVSDQSPLWSGQFEKPARDELQLQDEIALQVVDALAVSLSSNEHTALTKRYTESADAHALYVKGRYEWNKRSFEGLSESQRLFRNAIERDPNFALAYVGLADSLIFSYSVNEVDAALYKAIEIDPNLGEAYATQGFLLAVHRWKWKDAEASFKKAIDLNPGYSTAHHWYATLLGIEGRNDDAKAEMRSALEINPMSYNFLADLGQIFYFAHEYDKAREYCLKALELYPDFNYAHGYLSDIYLQTGEYEASLEELYKAERSLNRITSAAPTTEEEEQGPLAEWKSQLRKGGMRRFYEYCWNQSLQSAKNPGAPYGSAKRHAFLGDKSQALDELERACSERPFIMAWVKADPCFDSLRAEPRYRAILQRMGLS